MFLKGIRIDDYIVYIYHDEFSYGLLKYLLHTSLKGARGVLKTKGHS